MSLSDGAAWEKEFPPSTPTPDLDKFFTAEKLIHDYFGYKEDWVKIPLVDHREYYWILHQHEGRGGQVLYYDKSLTEEVLIDGAHYAAEIYTQRFLPKWVYETSDYTLICMDTQTDGNKYLGVFDNKKRQK